MRVLPVRRRRRVRRMVGGWEIGRELALLARQVRLDRKIRSEQQRLRNVKRSPYGGHLRVLKT